MPCGNENDASKVFKRERLVGNSLLRGYCSQKIVMAEMIKLGGFESFAGRNASNCGVRSPEKPALEPLRQNSRESDGVSFLQKLP